MHRFLLKDRWVDSALDLTWGLMLPGSLYWAAMVAFPAVPRVVTPFIACMVGAGAGSLYGAEKWWSGWLQRVLALPISVAMFVFASVGTFRVALDLPNMTVGMRFDFAASLLILWWGFYLFLSTALRQKRESAALSPRFAAPPR